MKCNLCGKEIHFWQRRVMKAYRIEAYHVKCIEREEGIKKRREKW